MTLLIPFAPEHLARMETKAGTASIIAARPETADTLVSLGAKTICAEDGTVIGIIGFVPLTPGVCEVFVLASKDQSRFPVAFARCVLKEIGNLCAKYRRIQAVTEDNSFHTRWIMWLGFVREGTLKKYGLNGEDMVMWGLT
jgi:hypothetical protein